MTDLLVIDGHPGPDSFTAALASRYGQAAEADGAHVERLELRSLRFDPILREGYRGEQPLEPDLVRAQAALTRAAHVAWFFPTWWTATPALLKGFVDRVLLPGFAFRYRSGRFQAPEKLLSGRSARFVTTMDTPGFWYTLVHHRALHAAFGGATLGFVGFSPVRSSTLHEARLLGDRGRRHALEAMDRAAASDVRLARRHERRQAPRAPGPRELEREVEVS